MGRRRKPEERNRKPIRIFYRWDGHDVGGRARVYARESTFSDPDVDPRAVVYLREAWSKWVDQGRTRAPSDGPRRVLGLVERFVITRVGKEEIGDALELIQRILNDPQARRVRWRVYWMVLRTSVWVVINSIRYLVIKALGRGTE